MKLLFILLALLTKADPLRVAGGNVELTVRALSDSTVRITTARISSGRPEEIADAPVLVDQPAGRVLLQARKSFPPKAFSVGVYRLSIESDPIAVIATDAAGRAVQAVRVDSDSGGISFSGLSTPTFGLGQGGKQFDRRGASYPIANGRGPWSMAEYGGYLPLPWLIGTGGWALFFHRPFSGTLNVTDEKGSLQAESGGALPIDLFLVLAASPARLLSQYARLTGRPSLPPIWALGYQQSHRTLAGPEEVLDVARTFRQKKLPCDVLIYLGTGYTLSGWNTGHGSFDFNPAVFLKANEILRQLRDWNYHVILHVTSPPKSLFGSVRDAAVREDDPNQALNYWRRHEPAIHLGVAGWWPDVGEELSQESRLARIRMYGEGMLATDPNSRPFALHRTGYAGMQRYGAWLWSGDVYSRWELLERQIAVGLNTSLSGVPFWGTDIGGFWPTRELTGELYVRWFQFGAFCPLFRSHGRAWHTRLPWGWNTGELGPEEIETRPPGQAVPDSSELHNPAVEPICRKYLELRYRLLPYSYSVFQEATETGLPVMRPLWLHEPEDETAVGRADEYMWGPAMLVAPVTREGATTRSLYLPRGVWHDFWNEERLEGGREIARPVDLETMPIFVSAGSIVPFGPVKQYTLEQTDGDLDIVVYPGANGRFVLYEDDGVSQKYARGEFAKTELAWDNRSRQFAIKHLGGLRTSRPVRSVTIRLAGEGKKRTMMYEGKPLRIQFDPEDHIRGARLEK